VSAGPASDVVELLRKLVAATPAPVSSCDPAELVEQAETIAAEREPLYQELGQAVAAEGARGVSAGAPLAEALADLDARWNAALAAARVSLNQRRTAAGRIRGY
jgi:hypothetical protein